MFSGIIEGFSPTILIRQKGGGLVLDIEKPPHYEDVSLGDSICINGTCLTVMELKENLLGFEVSPETLNCTTFADLKSGEMVNLERSVTLQTRLHGHLVTGHVDGIGLIDSLDKKGDYTAVGITPLDPTSLKFLVQKGSVTVDGVSLTVNRVDSKGFEVMIIPHTLNHTRFSLYKTGFKVNLEFDLLAKYLHKWYLDARS